MSNRLVSELVTKTGLVKQCLLSHRFKSPRWITSLQLVCLTPHFQAVDPSEVVAWARERGKVGGRVLEDFFHVLFSRGLT